ncbi:MULTISPECIES: hypothetical protein [Thermodesulfovibrio]|uniref:hypothetical protein n=1 Tax=Thermodesulfovibrio TaxID=28261 RepID=UPI00261F1AE8|nr:hypothetical protein [Thermodesulfovibrio sp.]
MPDEVNVVFSSHRVEFLSSIYDWMKQSDFIILEEAPNEMFRKMLKEEISIEEYLEEEIFEFPEFSYRFYEILKKLYRNGKEIVQIEPYMQKLLKIYDLFSDGKMPQDIEKIAELKDVYEVEKKATRELIDFYEASISNPFNEIVETVKKFAMADAERFRIRDSLRANAILDSLPQKGKVFIEAGAIHQYLSKLLSEKLVNHCKINKVFSLENTVKELTGKRWLFPPGDILTLRYIFNKRENEEWENLLSARSLIYIMLIEKEEMLPKETNKTPHLIDEIKVVRMVNKLSFKDCERLYREIRFKNKEKAKRIVNNFVLSKQQPIVL